ncbi:MAG: hypothetical protein K0S91_2205, partial [Nitrososphaeraceae archaeon]|nr:hypothetical protein [Nitrososphaeraceae archaeon]
KIVDNVQYDFMIMPAEDPETMITHRASKIAQNDSAHIQYTFPYRMEDRKALYL